QHAEQHGYSVVREFCGHGIGRKFHEEPQVLHYGKPATGLPLEPGMTFTIEPMINAGKPGIRELADGWTIVTKDHSLSAQWEHTGMSADAALVATGGYGRGELYPCSDIDLLVLLPEEPRAAEQERLERLIHSFWDIGLEIGHSVRTVRDCVQAAASDITVNTT